jgi:hypothetical protein
MNLRFALLALLVFGLSFAGLSISDYIVSPAMIEPGTSGYIQITISNEVALSPSGMVVFANTLENVAIEVTSVGDLQINRQFSVGDMDAASSVVVSIPFKASENISSGTYTAEVRAVGVGKNYYLDSTGALKSETETFEKRTSIPLQVVNKPVISVELSEDSLEDITQESFIFTNSGGAAKRLKAVITSPGIGFLNMDQIYVEELKDSSTVSASIDARGATEGASKLAIQLTYNDELGNEITETKEIPITVKKPEGDFVFSQKEPIVTGENEDLQLTISNLGGEITNLKFTFGTEEVLLRGMNEMRVGDLAAGAQKNIAVPVVANLAPGTQNVVLQLSWVESGEDRMGTITVPIEVVSDSTTGVYLEAKPAPLLAGGEHTISVTISNLGSYAIEGTTVVLESEALTLLTIQPEQYIGGLESDDFSSVQYKVRVNNVAPGTYPAKIIVKFRDASGKWITLNKEIGIAVSEPPPQEFPLIPVLIVLAVAAVVVYWKFFRKKK